MNETLDALNRAMTTPTVQLSFQGFFAALLVSVVTSGIIAVLYQLFYENKSTGAQIHRSFMLMGPSVTALFIAIQFSLPLSLGLLGALSIVRFRTPIKEPEEIAFIMLLIAAAVVCATFQYALLGVLLVVATLALLVQRFVPFFTRSGRKSGSLAIATDGTAAEGVQTKISDLVHEKINGVTLEHLTQDASGSTAQFAFSSLKEGRLEELQKALTEIKGVSRVDFYFNRNADWF